MKDDALLSGDGSELLRRIRGRTPARVLLGRAGAAYRTQTQLDLRYAHAAARDAVRTELSLEQQLGAEFVARWQLFEVCTQASTKDKYLARPDLGRVFSDEAKAEIVRRSRADCDLQIAIGDGLSVAAVSAQVPALLPHLCATAEKRGWTMGNTFVVRHCRVGILNQIGELLRAAVVVLLIGERPGLATAESLSAYMAYRPQPAHTDADRNLISNIHGRGIPPDAASASIIELAGQMMRMRVSGTRLNSPSQPLLPRPPDRTSH